MSGALTAGAAPVLAAGQYVDTAPQRGTTRFYRLRRSMDASVLHIGASARPAPGDAVATIHLDIRTSNGDSAATGSVLV